MADLFASICSACGRCDKGTCFAIVRKSQEELKGVSFANIPKTYSSGIRFTSDAMDCALPISVDSHSGCSFLCAYCFSNNLTRDPTRNKKKFSSVLQSGSLFSEFPVEKLERFLSGDCADRFSRAAYPLLRDGTPIQVGALGEPFDEIERGTGWMKRAVPLFRKYNIPVRISTKGGRLLQQNDYLALFDGSDRFWFAFSLISSSDEHLSMVDIGAPTASARLAAMKLLSKQGHKVSLRFRPVIPGLSDCYPGEPEAWKVLLDKAAEAGACAVSFEFIFLTSSPTDKQRAMYNALFRAIGKPDFSDFWNGMSDSKASCRRANRTYKEDLTWKVREHTHKLGMTFGCSDPHFKELSDSFCCCGIKDDDPVFGRFSRKSMLWCVVEGRRAWETQKVLKRFTYSDWKPEWAHLIPKTACVPGGSTHGFRSHKHQTFGDSLRNKWNNPKHPRGPWRYFGGCLEPVDVDSVGDVVYEYRPYTYRNGQVI